MTRYFISDLHLSDERPDLIRAFVNLMDLILRQQHHTNNPTELYILGDFYDRWIGDDYQSDWNTEIENKLKQLSNNHIAIFVCHGNRDFLLGNNWAQRIKANLINEGLVIQQNDKNVLLSHGDEACLDDTEYQKFRDLVRSKKWQEDFLALPLEERLSISAGLRSQSKSMKSEKNLDIMDVNKDEIDRLMSDSHAYLMIHGHTHRPQLHETKQGYRAVLGDWDRFAWLAVMQEDCFFQVKIELSMLSESKEAKSIEQLISSNAVEKTFSLQMQ